MALAPPLKGAEGLCGAEGAGRYGGYFNILACEKWMRYTSCTNYRLCIRVAGRGLAQVMATSGALAEQEFDLPEGGVLTLPFDPAGAKAAWLVLPEDAQLLEGAFEADAEPRDVRIAAAICTYRREGYVRKNVAALKRDILENPDSPLGGRLSLFVSDNAGTLGDLPGAQVFVNRNAGGAGGFARGLMEIERAGGFTHVVLMDDDVTLLPESFERLYALLSTLKPEYENAQVAGAMLRLDKPWVQHEAGAKWLGLMSESLAANLDLSSFEGIALDMAERQADYAAWWFACFPMAEVARAGLPLPLFVRMDDVEYGLRLHEKVLTLPGIAVWHEPFERKHSSKTEYYHARNALIVNALRRPEIDGVKLIRRLFLSTLMRFRYAHARMLLRGIADYLRGPDFLMNADPAALNDALEAAPLSPALQADADAAEKSAYVRDTRLSKALALLTLNGALIPSRRWARVYAHQNPLRAHFGKRGAVNVVADTGLGFAAARDNRAALGLLREYIGLETRLRREGAAVRAQWRAKESALTSRAFWTVYLQL